MFTTPAPFLLLDYFRAPYTVEGPDDATLPLRAVRAGASGRALLYPPAESAPQTKPRTWLLGPIRLYARALLDAEMQSSLSAHGGTWRRTEPLTTLDGAASTSIWRSHRGDVALPVDPSDVILNFWSERYRTDHSTSALMGRTSVQRAYYTVRPLLPRRAQIAIRRAISHLQARAEFPQWPVEKSLHDFYRWLFDELREVAGTAIPTIASWPKGRRWALVLTHDVETAVGAANIEPLREIEAVRGFRSSWNFVPHRYHIDDAVLRELVEAGFEVGVHGLKHDGRDFESLATLQRRLPEIRQHAERWNAVGFRSPATHRRWEWMPLLGFDYDSSYPDTDPYEPHAGGCCTWLPFFNGELVELPITLPQDYTLFSILRLEDEQAWLSKARFLREEGGMALLITHPDYMREQRYLDAYARLLDEFTGDATLWHALPREASAWWRQRAASSISRTASGWTVSGPAADVAQIIEN